MAEPRKRPILFSGPMVRAILDGRKTQTRRICKAFKPPHGERDDDGWPLRMDGYGDYHREPCPYGQPGDRLWVRESAYIAPPDFGASEPNWPRDHDGRPRCVGYSASMDSDSVRCAKDYGVKMTPSIHMPRWASRLTLEVVSVRVERLQAISEEDARAEGVLPVNDPFQEGNEFWECHDPKCVREGGCAGVLSARKSFETLWESINGAGSWDANPWLWVVEFRRVEVAHAR